MKVLPLYLPHQGCTHRCVYCNQPLIIQHEDDRSLWKSRIEDALKRYPHETWELAFYGGTFSALPIDEMADCFAVIEPYLHGSHTVSIRISTRPDAVSDEVLQFLKDHAVQTIELGAESFDNAVLKKSARGHTATMIHEASQRIQQMGFTLGLHLMCGLPGQTPSSWQQTIKETCGIKPDFVRIAPTLVMHETPLEILYQRGGYRPMTLDEAIQHCAMAYQAFVEENIKIIRVGLALSDSESDGHDKVVAGPWHPSLRQEVEAYLIQQTVLRLVQDSTQNDAVDELMIHPKDVSIVHGSKKANLQFWKNQLGQEFHVSATDGVDRYKVYLGTDGPYSLFTGRKSHG